MKRIFAIALCLLLILGLFAGCSNSDKAYVPTGDGLSYDEDYTGPIYTRPQGPGQEKLTLTYYPNVTMNPISCTDFTNRALFSLIYQSLFYVDRDYNIEPILCKKFTVSKDMKKYTFYLEEAKFSDGTTLTAQDVLETYNAAKKSDFYGGRFAHIKKMSVSDGAFVITLSTPYENLPLLLDIPIVKKSQVKSKQPLGTGPYVLDTSADAAVLRKNENWWCSAKLAVDTPAISLVKATSATQIRDTFEFEDLSLVYADPGSDKYADYRCDYELWDCENNIFLFLSVNMKSKVFSNDAIRAALPLAVDREDIADSFYRGFARASSLPASPLSPYYSQVLAEKYAYDKGEALKKAVEKAKLSSDTKVVLLVNSDDTLRTRVAKSVASMLKKAGLKVTVSAKKTSSYKKALKNGSYDLVLGQTKLSSNMDLSNFFATKGALNYGGISDVALNKLCTDALANYGNYYTLHQNVLNDGRLCPILFRSYAVYAVRGLLTDLTPARDNVFYYSLGKTMEKAKTQQK